MRTAASQDIPRAMQHSPVEVSTRSFLTLFLEFLWFILTVAKVHSRRCKREPEEDLEEEHYFTILSASIRFSIRLRFVPWYQSRILTTRSSTCLKPYVFIQLVIFAEKLTSPGHRYHHIVCEVLPPLANDQYQYHTSTIRPDIIQISYSNPYRPAHWY